VRFPFWKRSGTEGLRIATEADIEAGFRDIRLGKAHTWQEWEDLEADGVLCLGFVRGQAGSHMHWPTVSDPALD
jgi:hypothetical protein